MSWFFELVFIFKLILCVCELVFILCENRLLVELVDEIVGRSMWVLKIKKLGAVEPLLKP